MSITHPFTGPGMLSHPSLDDFILTAKYSDCQNQAKTHFFHAVSPIENVFQNKKYSKYDSRLPSCVLAMWAGYPCM